MSTTTRDDLQNAVPTVRCRVGSNNEDIALYPGDTTSDTIGVVKHEYATGGVAVYDVVGWEIVDMDASPDEDPEMVADMTRQWLNEVVFADGGHGVHKASYAGSHTFELADQEGSSVTVALETTNKR